MQQNLVEMVGYRVYGELDFR